MSQQIGMLLAIRECLTVALIGLGLFCLSSESFWGLILGFGLVSLAFLFSASFRIEDYRD
ncbi:MAG: hypothetical protein O2954_12140 [bacterium]|nr:hypothetical protein [bacterium]